jgi:hypothetical protein
MKHLSRSVLQDLLTDKMQQTRHKQATMAGMQSFYIQIMTDIHEDHPDCEPMGSIAFRKFVRGWARTTGSLISMRHETDGEEIFYLTVKLCPMDRSKINRILCGWLNRDHRCG